MPDAPPPTGYYWIRFGADDADWQPAFYEARNWYLIGCETPFYAVAEVGPRLAAPPPPA
jgi:hypothetical protein